MMDSEQRVILVFSEIAEIADGQRSDAQIVDNLPGRLPPRQPVAHSVPRARCSLGLSRPALTRLLLVRNASSRHVSSLSLTRHPTCVMADTISAAAQRLEQLSVNAAASADLLNKFFETCKQASRSSADLTAACTPSTARIFAVANAHLGLPAPAIRSLQESPWHLALDTILDFFGPSGEFLRSLHRVSETSGITWS